MQMCTKLVLIGSCLVNLMTEVYYLLRSSVTLNSVFCSINLNWNWIELSKHCNALGFRSPNFILCHMTINRMSVVPHGRDKGPTSPWVPSGPPKSTQSVIKTPKNDISKCARGFDFLTAKKRVLWGPTPNLPSGWKGQARIWTLLIYHTWKCEKIARKR
jgi:hypothetical protein